MPRRLASSAMSRKRSWAIGSPCPCSSISSRQGSSSKRPSEGLVREVALIHLAAGAESTREVAAGRGLDLEHLHRPHGLRGGGAGAQRLPVDLARVEQRHLGDHLDAIRNETPRRGHRHASFEVRAVDAGAGRQHAEGHQLETARAGLAGNRGCRSDLGEGLQRVLHRALGDEHAIPLQPDRRRDRGSAAHRRRGPPGPRSTTNRPAASERRPRRRTPENRSRDGT